MSNRTHYKSLYKSPLLLFILLLLQAFSNALLLQYFVPQLITFQLTARRAVPPR